MQIEPLLHYDYDYDYDKESRRVEAGKIQLN